MADNKNGNFAVMHLDLGHPDKPKRNDAAMRNDAAKRTSEGTEAAARIANQAGYQSVKRSKLAWTPQDPDPSNPSHAPAGLLPHDAKSEQARLLSLLQNVNPGAVVEQLRKAVAFFGGIPGTPAPDSRAAFPQSHQSNGSGSQFVSWLAEIFPPSADHTAIPPVTGAPNSTPSHSQAPPVSTQPPQPQSQSFSQAPQPDMTPNDPSQDAPSEAANDPNAPAVPVKRGRGRPKGSKGKPKNKDPQPDGADPAAGIPDAAGNWPGHPLYSQPQGTAGQSESGTPGKKRGRPKGSKNKPKNPEAAASVTEPPSTQPADESQQPFMSPMAQISQSLNMGQDGARSSSGPLGVSNMIEPNNVHSQGNWSGMGMQPSQDASPAASRKRKGDKTQADPGNNSNSAGAGAGTGMMPGAHQDGMSSMDSAGKRRRISKDQQAVYSQMGQPSRMNSSESPVQNASFQSPSQQMMASNSFDPAQQPPNRKSGSRSQPPGRQAQQQQFNHQPGQSQPQGQPQPFNHQPGQHKSPVIGGNPPQQPSGPMDMSGPGLSRSAMYNQQQQQQFQQFMNQQRMSVEMNPGTNTPGQFSQGSNDGKSPMFPQGHMVRAASGDNQRPSPASQSAQLNHDPSRMGSAGFGGRAPPATSAGASPSLHSTFSPNYSARGYMGMNYGGMSGGRVPDQVNHSFGGSTGQMDSMGGNDQASMRHRMYQSMQQQQQRQ